MIPGLLLRTQSRSGRSAQRGAAYAPAVGVADDLPANGCPAHSTPDANGACFCDAGYSWSDANQECALTSSGTFGGGSTPSGGGGTPAPGGTTKPLLPTSNPLVPLVIAAAFLGTIAFVLAETAPKAARVRRQAPVAHRSR